VGGVGPFTEQECYSFDLQGFVVRRGVLDADELGTIHHTIDDLKLPTPGADIASQRFSRFLQHEVFRTLMDHDAVLQPVVELCGPTVRLDHCYGIIMSPGTNGLGFMVGQPRTIRHSPTTFTMAKCSTGWLRCSGRWLIIRRGPAGSVVC
jgi:hypothetical protein